MTTEIVFGHDLKWGHFAAATPLLGLLIWQAYRWMIVPISASRRAVLLALRATWSLLLLWCLFEPVLETVINKDENIPPSVMVMVDVSSSMALPDDKGADRWQGVKETTTRLRALLDQSQVRKPNWQALGSQLRPWTEDTPAKDDQSLILQQLRDAAEKQPGPAATVLFLLTDGADTTEATPVEAIAALKAHSIRVFPIAPEGSVRPPALARVERVIAPQQVSPNQAFEIEADLRLRCADAADFTIALDLNGKEVAQQVVHHQGDGTIRKSFPIKAEAAGLVLYTIRLLDGKKTELSHLSASVRSKTRDALKVLYVQGAPDWEYRYLRQSVGENPSILLEGMTQLENQSFLHQAAGKEAQQGQKDASPQAAVRAAAQNGDVVVLANTGPELLDAETQKALLDLVRKRGGGVLFFSGDSAQSARFRGTLLEELLPVTLDDTAVAPPSALGAMQITADGLASEIWRDASTAAALAQPPATFAHFVRAKGVKPGATILAVHPTEKNGNDAVPLLASQNIGAGRTAFLGVDALWRWKMAAAAPARDYDRFWQQLLLWLGGRIQGTTIEMDRGRYAPGDTAHIKVNTVKSDTPPKFVVKDPAGKESDVALSWSAGNTEGKADFRFAGPGEFVFMARNGAEVLAQQVEDVRTTDLELEHAGLNEPLLQQLAKESGGQYLTTKDMDLIPSFLKTSHHAYSKRERKALWHSPWIFAVMLAAYGAELLLRRKYQLT